MRDTSRSSGFGNVVKFLLQAMEMLLGFAVLMLEQRGEQMGYGGREGCFACNCKNAAGLQRSIGLGYEYLRK